MLNDLPKKTSKYLFVNIFICYCKKIIIEIRSLTLLVMKSLNLKKYSNKGNI